MKIERFNFQNLSKELIAGEAETNVRMWVVSKKNNRFKELNLKELSPEERAEKLNKWGMASRFVFVIEVEGQIFAHMHTKHAEQWQKEEKLFSGDKKIVVKSLTDEEAAHLMLVAKAFAEKLNGPMQQKEKRKAQSKVYSNLLTSQVLLFQKFAPYVSLEDAFPIEKSIKLSLSELILKLIRQHNQALIEEKKKQDEASLHFEIIKWCIQKDELKKCNMIHAQRQEEIMAHTIKNFLFHI